MRKCDSMKANLLVAAAGVLSIGVLSGAVESPNVTAYDEAVKSVQVEGAARAASRGGRCYGLFVGINKYSNAYPQTPLYGCVNDVYNMKDAWTDSATGQCLPENAYMLTDSSATWSAIRTRFQSLASTAVSGDTVLYYHSSHGGLENEYTKSAVICTYNGDYTDSEFADDLARFASGVKVVIVLDTCNSAGMFKASGVPTFAERVQAMVNERVAQSGNGTRASASIGWVTAADWYENSSDGGWYDSTYGHTGRGGVFTVALLDGWTKSYADSDGNGVINFRELYVYAQNNCDSSSVQALNESVLQSVTAKGKTAEGTYIRVDGADEDIRWTYNSGAAQYDSFSLECNGSWTISVNGAWIQNLAPSSGTGNATVSFRLAANTQAGQRTGTIVITSGAITFSIIVVQPSQTPVSIVFDGNGGKPAKQTIRQIPGTQWNTLYLEQPSRPGYIFDGWWTDKTGGEEVDVFLGTSKFSANTTLYAHWLKEYKVTVNGGEIYLVRNGGDDLLPMGTSYSFYNGTFFVIVPRDQPGKAFSHWTCSPDKFDLGSGYAPRDELNVVKMPEANISFTANYMSNPGYLTVQALPINPTDNEVDESVVDLQQFFEWSVDKKVWNAMELGRIFAVGTGKATVSFRANNPRWTLSAPQNVTIETDRCVDLFPIATRVSVIEPEAVFEDGDAVGSVTMSPATGQVLSGKPVTLTAKPGKDTVFAYWETDDGFHYYTSTLKLAPSVDTHLRAVFRHKSSVVSPYIEAENVFWSQNSVVGVAFEMAIGLPLDARPAKFSATGLPKGLKIDAQSGIISGIPTQAGIFHANVSVASGAGSSAKHTRTIRIDISPLPAWAQGTFSGMVYGEVFDDEDGEWYLESGTYGSATFTATSAGKISGKVSQYGTNSTFTADSYDVDSYTDDDESEWQLLIHGEMKTGKNVRDIWLVVQKEVPPDPELANAFSYGFESGDDYSFMFWRNMWQDKATSFAASRAIADVEGMYSLSLMAGDDYGFGWLSTSIPSSGAVKATGKLADGTAVTISAPLLYDPAYGGYFAFFYNAPSAYKGGSVFFVPVFDPEGDVTPLGYSQWTSASPTATAVYGDGFFRDMGFVGYWYSSRRTMRQMGYDTLQFVTDWPDLSVVLKYTHFNDFGLKVTQDLNLGWEPVDTSNQSGNTVYVNYSGTGFITDQVTKPVQNGGQWIYGGGNDGALTVTFTPATGVFKGTYTFWYDYWKSLDETTGKESKVHTSKKVTFEGILVPGYDLGGFFLWDDTSFYTDAKTGKLKSYKYKQSCRMRLLFP